MKRANSESFNHGMLIDARTGEKYEIKNDNDFLIGCCLNGSLVLKATYISRRHCTIKYQDNQFIIFDNNSNSGTFLNFEKLEKGLTNFKVLYDSDLITFGDSKEMEFIYKFSLSSNMDKGSRLDNDQIKDEDDDPQHKQLVENSQKSLNIIHSKVLNKNDVIEKLIKDYECLETIALLDDLNNQVGKILENYLLCSICSEVFVKMQTTNCAHSFCESCLKQWMNRSKNCPICHTRLNTITNLFVMDNCITKLCSIIGGTIKEQHDIIIRERNESSQSKKRGEGRQEKNAAMSTTQAPMVQEPDANLG